MTIDEFWNLIQKSRRYADDCDEQAENLQALLEKLKPEEIIAFSQHFRERLAESYRWDLWAVAFIVKGGCSDDGFEYFRGWLIAQGRKYFEEALADPTKAARRAGNDEEVECEAIFDAALDAYQAKTGEEMPRFQVTYPQEPVGEPWTEDDLPRLYPKLCK